MSESEFVRSLLVYGVAAIKGNDRQEARSNFNRVLYQIDASCGPENRSLVVAEPDRRKT